MTDSRNSAEKKMSKPTYQSMITDALVSLQDRKGSSFVALWKCMQGMFPESATDRKIAFTRLKKLAEIGLLTKVKNHFKLSLDYQKKLKKDASVKEKKTLKVATLSKKPKAAAKKDTSGKSKSESGSGSADKRSGGTASNKPMSAANSKKSTPKNLTPKATPSKPVAHEDVDMG